MLRAIIVDDEILVRATLEKMVDWAAEGFQLAGCYANGQAALEAMERCPADLVFTDIKMPVCSGLEFIDGVHALGLAPHIVVLSAFDEFPLVKQAFKKGAADLCGQAGDRSRPACWSWCARHGRHCVPGGRCAGTRPRRGAAA